MTSWLEDGPYGALSDLWIGSFREIGLYALDFAVLVALSLLLRRALRRRSALRALAPVAAQLLFFAKAQSVFARLDDPLLYFAVSLCFALLLTSQVWVMRLMPFGPDDYGLFFSLLLIPQHFFNSASTMLGEFIFFLVIFAAIYAAARLCPGGIRGNRLSCGFLYAWLCMTAFLSQNLMEPAVKLLEGVWPLGGGYAAVVAVNAALLVSAPLGRLLRGRMLEINRLGRKYARIERCFLWASVSIVLFFTLLYVIFVSVRALSVVLAYVLPFLCILSFILQLVTISLVYSAVLYKETATGNAWELEERAAYYAGLERSLTDMQRVRHDIKNVFVTMGGFVDRSDDPEMKAFFWEKIQPFAGDVIRRSELFARLKSIPSEPLRAFLYAKAEQAAQCGVVFHMEVRVVPEQFRLGMDVIDLTRVLGILLDNATEEAALVPSGQVRMTVTTQAGGATYRIANSITQATREQGVVLGRTTKGTGRGNGLAIVDALLAQYDNVLLSSLIVEEGFVQALNIETEVCNRIERGGGIVERPL